MIDNKLPAKKYVSGANQTQDNIHKS